MPPALVFLLALLLLQPAQSIFAAAPGLNLATGRTLAPQHQVLEAQVTFEDGYPHFAGRMAQGMSGRLEFVLGGLFRHAKVSAFGTEHRHDSDEFETGLRWQFPLGRKPGFSLVPAAGYSWYSSTTESSDGNRLAESRKRVWTEVLAAAGAPEKLTLSAAYRGLHDGSSSPELAVTILGIETSASGRFALLADYGLKLKVPSEWSSPWAAGVRFPQKKLALTLYASNVPGPARMSSTGGTDFLFYNFRITLLM